MGIDHIIGLGVVLGSLKEALRAEVKVAITAVGLEGKAEGLGDLTLGQEDLGGGEED